MSLDDLYSLDYKCRHCCARFVVRVGDGHDMQPDRMPDAAGAVIDTFAVVSILPACPLCGQRSERTKLGPCRS